MWYGVSGRHDPTSLRDWRPEPAGAETTSLSPLTPCHMSRSCTHCPDVPCKHLSIRSNITIYCMSGWPAPPMRTYSRACHSGTPALHSLRVWTHACRPPPTDSPLASSSLLIKGLFPVGPVSPLSSKGCPTPTCRPANSSRWFLGEVQAWSAFWLVLVSVSGASSHLSFRSQRVSDTSALSLPLLPSEPKATFPKEPPLLETWVIPLFPGNDDRPECVPPEEGHPNERILETLSLKNRARY